MKLATRHYLYISLLYVARQTDTKTKNVPQMEFGNG